jgi:hypothetical protein
MVIIPKERLSALCIGFKDLIWNLLSLGAEK